MQDGMTRSDVRSSKRKQHSVGRNSSSRAELLVELLNLHNQLEQIALSPAVTQAHQLTAQVAQVLEPVWSVVTASAEAKTGGVGYLRRYGVPDPNQEAAATNAAVAEQAVRVYGSLDLVAPSARDVWLSLAQPATALWCSVQDKHCRSSEGDEVRERSADSVTPTVRPVLPSTLLGSWSRDSDVVPALRRVLRRWCELVRHSSGEQANVARLTLAAAMLARGAVLDGDTATVKWFIDKWLGLNATESRVDGASAALLENGWTASTADSELSAVIDAVTTLRIESKYQHRLHRPVWETQLSGLPVALFSEEEFHRSSGDPSLILADVLTDQNDYSVLDIITDSLLVEQVHAVLDTLSRKEAEVVYALASGEMRKQVMQKWGLTRYQLDRLEGHVIRKLRHPTRAQVLRDYLD